MVRPATNQAVGTLASDIDGAGRVEVHRQAGLWTKRVSHSAGDGNSLMERWARVLTADHHRQRKTPRRRRAALLELGVRERLASKTAGSGRGRGSRSESLPGFQIFTGAGSQRARASASSSGRMGLERWASMPARRHSSRSPGMELAVRAMTGVWRPDSSRRIMRAAS